MRFNPIPPVVILLSLLAAPSWAAETAVDSAQPNPSLAERAANSIQTAVGSALNLVGIRYRQGGDSPDTGFDCSGFVGHVFREGMGLILPRTSREISQTGAQVKKDELRPGDLVFFNTMRQTFSHVGIYLGNNQFIHAPRSGGAVRIEDMRISYWAKRYEGARRISNN